MKEKRPFLSRIFLPVGLLFLGGALLLFILFIGRGARPLELLSTGFLALGGIVLLWKTLGLPTLSWREKRIERKPLTLSSLLGVTILSLAAVVFLWAYQWAQQTPSIPQSTVHAGITYEKGKVLDISKNQYETQQDFEDVPVGKQFLTVELTSGDYAGQRFYEVVNNMSFLYGTPVKVGDSVTLAVVYEDGTVTDLVLQDFDRSSPLLLVLALFLLLTVLVGGKVGAKSLLSLCLTFVCLFSILIPLLIGGAPTLPTVLAMCAFVTVVDFVLLTGVNKKTLCAILGTVSGVVVAAVFGRIACEILRVNGYKTYEVDSTIEALLQIKQMQPVTKSLQIGDLLVGGILIAALGAVNDVAMSISSAMKELITVNPDLSRKELFKSGITIGRDMVGTMTNTLILAFVGASLVMMIYLVSLEPSYQQLMSTAYLSVEAVQALASSAGVILAVPLSVLFGTLLFGHKAKK